MRFKNRYYLVEIVWEPAAAASSAGKAAPLGGAAAAAASASVAASSTCATAASAPSPSPCPSAIPPARICDPSLQAYGLQTVLRDAVREHFGDLAAGRTMQSLQVRYLNALTNTAIVRVARDDHRALGTAMAMVTALRGRPVILRTAHLGGTIRCCQKAAVALQRQKMDELRLQLAAAAAAVAPDAAAEPDAASVAALGGVLIGSSARSNQSGVTRNAQQTLRQLSALLSQYQGARAAQAAAASTHAAPATIPALAAQLARGEQAVLATPQAIARAIDQAAAAAEDEIAAMEV